MKKHKKYGFTISELLIALGVVAVLTAVLMPIIHSLIPDQNTLMAKRAFYTTETIIGNMINNNDCYPRQQAGFNDGGGYRRCLEWDNNAEEDAAGKFVSMFLSKLDLRGGAVQNGESYTFTTKDGMHWELQSVGFGAAGNNTVLVVDVDGPNKGPNCGQVDSSGECAKINDQDRTKGFDKFTMTIRPGGKIVIEDCWAVKAARTDKKLVGTFEEGNNCDFNANANPVNGNNPPNNPPVVGCQTPPQAGNLECCSEPQWQDLDVCKNIPPVPPVEECTQKPVVYDAKCCSAEYGWTNELPCKCGTTYKENLVSAGCCAYWDTTNFSKAQKKKCWEENGCSGYGYESYVPTAIWDIQVQIADGYNPTVCIGPTADYCFSGYRIRNLANSYEACNPSMKIDVDFDIKLENNEPCHNHWGNLRPYHAAQGGDQLEIASSTACQYTGTPTNVLGIENLTCVVHIKNPDDTEVTRNGCSGSYEFHW